MMLQRGLWVGLLLVVATLTACSHEVADRRPNVVLIVVDTLRADRLSVYGCPLETAPFLANLAQRSAVFESVWSPSSWTLPATVSMVTSVHPFQHGVVGLDGLELEPGDEAIPVNAIPEEFRTAAEWLGDAGYSTFGLVSNVLVGSEIGFDRGFDRFLRLDDEDADAVNTVVEEWKIELESSEPYFLYLHYFDPHDPFHVREPWFDLASGSSDSGWPMAAEIETFEDLDWLVTRLKPPPPWIGDRSTADLSADELQRLLEWMQAAYDSEIGFLDSRFEQLFELLPLDDALVVVTSDHGEEFYGHGDLTHGHNLYAETVRVPLVIQRADNQRGERISKPVSTIDIVPTLAGLLGIAGPRKSMGIDLFAENESGAVLSSLAAKSSHRIEDDLRSILVDDYRLIASATGAIELFEHLGDPEERIDLAQREPQHVEQLLERYRLLERDAPKFRAHRIPEGSNEAILEHLKGLSYVGN